MTVLIWDARAKVASAHEHHFGNQRLVYDLLYADDTLLIDDSSSRAQAYMEAIIEVGSEYGLEITWRKVDLSPIKCHPKITNTMGYDCLKKIQSNIWGHCSIQMALFKVNSIDGWVLLRLNSRPYQHFGITPISLSSGSTAFTRLAW